MSKQRKFTSRESILTAIDSLNTQTRNRSEEAALLGGEADELFRKSVLTKYAKDAPSMIVQAEECRLKERKLRKLLRRVPERMERLKNVLAEFDTELLPGQTDRSVVLK